MLQAAISFMKVLLQINTTQIGYRFRPSKGPPPKKTWSFPNKQVIPNRTWDMTELLRRCNKWHLMERLPTQEREKANTVKPNLEEDDLITFPKFLTWLLTGDIKRLACLRAITEQNTKKPTAEERQWGNAQTYVLPSSEMICSRRYITSRRRIECGYGSASS